MRFLWHRGDTTGKAVRRHQTAEGSVVVPPIRRGVMMQKQRSSRRVHGENGMRQIALCRRKFLWLILCFLVVSIPCSYMFFLSHESLGKMTA